MKTTCVLSRKHRPLRAAVHPRNFPDQTELNTSTHFWGSPERLLVKSLCLFLFVLKRRRSMIQARAPSPLLTTAVSSRGGSPCWTLSPPWPSASPLCISGTSCCPALLLRLRRLLQGICAPRKRRGGACVRASVISRRRHPPGAKRRFFHVRRTADRETAPRGDQRKVPRRRDPCRR